MVAGDSEITGELNLSGILNGGEEVPGGAVRVNVDEEVRWLNGIVSSTRLSEVVRDGD